MRGLKYVSWGDTTGYAVAAKAYVRALHEAGIPVTWAPMMPGGPGYDFQADRPCPDPSLAAVCNRPLDYDTLVIHTVPEYYPQWLQRERQPGRRIFGYTVWELERLPSHWPAILNQLDGVLVPCQWNVEVFRRSGVTVPIHVVPHLSQFENTPLATPDDHQALHARLGLAGEARRFLFYTVGFWSNRKAPYLALQAYWRAFNADDPVAMVVKTCNKDITRWHRHWRNAFRLRHPSPQHSVARLARQHARPAAVSVIADESLSDGEMLALHERGDCFVSLTRTEGWGLGAFEAARLGKPVIMTGYGGQTDYLAASDAYLVDYQMVPVHEPTWSASYTPSDRWAEPSVDSAARYMREVFEQRSAAQARGARLKTRIARDFARSTIVDAYRRALA